MRGPLVVLPQIDTYCAKQTPVSLWVLVCSYWRASTRRHRLERVRAVFSLEKGLSGSSEDEFSTGSRNAMFAERFIFQNLVHSHTKGFEESGLRTHGGGYSWIVDKIREFVGRWFGNPESQNLGIFGWWGGFVRGRWAAADSRASGAPPWAHSAPANAKGRLSQTGDSSSGIRQNTTPAATAPCRMTEPIAAQYFPCHSFIICSYHVAQCRHCFVSGGSNSPCSLLREDLKDPRSRAIHSLPCPKWKRLKPLQWRSALQCGQPFSSSLPIPAPSLWPNPHQGPQLPLPHAQLSS